MKSDKPPRATLKDVTANNKNVIPVFKRNELRLRRDIEPLKDQLAQLEINLQKIRNNPKIADSNEAIMSYLEKAQNRRFLSVILLLMRQVNSSRDKKDFEFMLRLRSLLIALNFPQVSQLARHDDRIVAADTVKLMDTKIANYKHAQDLKIYDANSEFMNVIQLVFSDVRPSNEDSQHSTIAILNPTKYFFKQFMNFSSTLDKGLIGRGEKACWSTD